MASFSVPYVAPNPTSWGPPSEPDTSNPNAPQSKFALLPYAPFGRSDRLGRAADFTGRNQYNNNNNNNNRGGGYRRGGDDNKEFQYKVDAEEESSFQLVDTSKANTSTARRFVTPAAKRRQHTQRLRQVNARRQQQNQGPSQMQSAQRTRAGGRRGPGGRGGRQYAPRVDRQASVSVQPDWTQVEEMDLSKLTKNLTASTDVPNPEDILWCGFLDQYNDAYDKITARAPVNLKKNETKEFYPVTTTDDPVLEKLAIDGNGNVFITDAILAHLMTCTRSVYPWDIVIQKLPGGTLFFDKRDNSQFDYLTVSETAHSPPTNDDPDGINTPERLGLEATIIHQNFSQQILKSKGARQQMQLPNPFYDEDDNDGMEPASVAYRYRKFDLGGDAQLVCRTELHGIVKKTQYMTAFALNEYPTAAIPAWRERIDAQSGAVLAQELKNNSFKLAKWTAASLLAGADQMKIGFVSRTAAKNAYEHQILATQFYRPKDFATQITLAEGNMWAMIRMFISLMRKHEDGKYVLMRDPNKAVLRLFKVPPNTFEDEDDEEHGEEGGE